MKTEEKVFKMKAGKLYRSSYWKQNLAEPSLNR